MLASEGRIVKALEALDEPLGPQLELRVGRARRSGEEVLDGSIVRSGIGATRADGALRVRGRRPFEKPGIVVVDLDTKAIEGLPENHDLVDRLP